jgi:hypothetical protein
MFINMLSILMKPPNDLNSMSKVASVQAYEHELVSL